MRSHLLYMINPRIERKLGADILATIADIELTPKDQIKRFLILKKRLKKRIARYTEYTGSEFLLHKPSQYGFEQQ